MNLSRDENSARKVAERLRRRIVPNEMKPRRRVPQTLLHRRREGRKSFSGLNLNGRGLVGVLGVIGTEEHIPCDVRLPAWTPIHTKLSPLKAVWLQNRLAFDITAARPVTDTIPIAPGDVNAKLV